MGYRQKPRARPEQALHLGKLELALVGDGHDAQARSDPLAQHLPGHDVGVVFHRGDDDLVSRAHVSVAVASRHQVIASVAPRTNTISSACCALTKRRAFRAPLVCRRRARAPGVHAPMNVGPPLAPWRATASITEAGIWVVAALSR